MSGALPLAVHLINGQGPYSSHYTGRPARTNHLVSSGIINICFLDIYYYNRGSVRFSSNARIQGKSTHYLNIQNLPRQEWFETRNQKKFWVPHLNRLRWLWSVVWGFGWFPSGAERFWGHWIQEVYKLYENFFLCIDRVQQGIQSDPQCLIG